MHLKNIKPPVLPVLSTNFNKNAYLYAWSAANIMLETFIDASLANELSEKYRL